MRQRNVVQVRMTKKHGKNHYGYNNHISADNKYKMIHHDAATTAEMHDIQAFETLLDEINSCGNVYADAAYRDKARDKALSESNYQSTICRKEVAVSH